MTVPMRPRALAVLGSALHLPRTQWHLLPVNHIEPITLLRLDGRSYLDLTPDQVARISDALVAPKP